MANLIALQMVSGPDPEENLNQVESLLRQLRVDEPTLVVLPECFACFGGGDRGQLDIAEPMGNGPVQARLADMAKQYGVWIASGSLPTKAADEDKFQASCILINDQGQHMADYQKIHLFDVQVADNTGQYLESRFTRPGEKVTVVDTPFGRLGIAICYDIRFAGLFQAMEQIDLLIVPAAFTAKTGEAHWHTLLKARAIEKQCYLVAANQGGTHKNGRQTYGHSCIISPWGEVIMEVANGPGIAMATPDPQLISRLRQSMPVHAHNKFRSYLV